MDLLLVISLSDIVSVVLSFVHYPQDQNNSSSLSNLTPPNPATKSSTLAIHFHSIPIPNLYYTQPANNLAFDNTTPPTNPKLHNSTKNRKDNGIHRSRPPLPLRHHHDLRRLLRRRRARAQEDRWCVLLPLTYVPFLFRGFLRLRELTSIPQLFPPPGSLATTNNDHNCSITIPLITMMIIIPHFSHPHRPLLLHREPRRPNRGRLHRRRALCQRAREDQEDGQDGQGRRGRWGGHGRLERGLEGGDIGEGGLGVFHGMEWSGVGGFESGWMID